MTHTRIRKFNTRDAYPEQKLDNDVCMAVRAGNTVYLRGQTAMDLDGKIVGIGDAGRADRERHEMREDPARGGRRKAGGRGQDHDLHHRSRLSRAGLSVVGQVAEGRLSRCRPESSSQGLAKPEYLMEIDIIAEIPADR